MLNHKRNGFCGGQLRRQNQITFVFAGFIVSDDNRLTDSDGVNSRLNSVEFHASSLVLNWIMRAIWRASKSVSKFMTSPTVASPIVVASKVSGIRKISK